jgi:HAD superfamily hydrolase (TIGR01509 family)
MSTLRTLFLDAGGVLVHPNWQRAADTLARHGTPVAAAQLAAADPKARRDIDRATVIRETDDRTRGWRYFDLVLAHAGVTATEATDRALADLQAYHREHNVWEHLPADVVPALGRLRARGLRLVVVSNANGRLAGMLARIGLRPHVDVVLDSFDWGVEKPDPRLFQLALAHAGAEASSTVHVGDLYHVDVAGARAAGLAGAVLFDAAGLYPEADCPRVDGWAALEAYVATTLGAVQP